MYRNQSQNNSRIFFDVLFVFLYLFQPPIIRFPLKWLLDIYMLLYIAFKTNVKSQVDREKIKEFFKPFIPFGLYFFLFMCFKILSSTDRSFMNEYINNVYQTTLIFLHVIILIVYLEMRLLQKKYTVQDIRKIIIIVSFMQLVCVVASLLLPGIRELFLQTIIKNTESEVVRSVLNHLNTRRGYGFANNLFDTFGYLVSLLVVIVFNIGYKRNSVITIVYSFILIFMALLNSRTGVMLSVVGIVVSMLYAKRRQYAISIIKGAFVLVLFIVIANQAIKLLPHETQIWFEKSISDVNGLLSDNKTEGTIYNLSQDYVLPSNIVFGAGGRPEQFGVFGLDGSYIDVGYFQLVWRYGLIGTALLLYGYLKIFIKSIKKNDDVGVRRVIISTLIIFLFNLLKIFNLTYFNANMLIFGIPYLSLYWSKMESQSHEIWYDLNLKHKIKCKYRRQQNE